MQLFQWFGQYGVGESILYFLSIWYFSGLLEHSDPRLDTSANPVEGESRVPITEDYTYTNGITDSGHIMSKNKLTDLASEVITIYQQLKVFLVLIFPLL